MYEIKFHVEWDGAHRLMAIDGTKFYPKTRCGSLHGHHWEADIVLQGNKLDEFGFVLDFGVAKKAIKQFIDNNWDHATICHPYDYDLQKFLKDQGDRYYILDVGETPSAESISKVLFNICLQHPEIGDLIKSVTVWETKTNSATYSL